jgi:malate dehydrogenase (oxaloacetate-decarboxylating)(NADP+)
VYVCVYSCRRRQVKPTAILGLSGRAGLFTETVLREMSQNCSQPIVFAMSNPTNCSECTAEEAYEFTQGRCIFASGSPFEPVMYDGVAHPVSQINNMYIFPGLGLGVVASEATRITDDMFVASAKYVGGCTCSVTLCARC